MVSKAKYDKLKKKITVLLNKQKPSRKEQNIKFSDHTFYPRFVNLSNTEFNNKEVELLEKGPKFAPQDNRSRKDVIGVQAELIISNNANIIDNSSLHKHKVAEIIKKTQTLGYPSNVKVTLKDLTEKRTQNKLIFTKADKGNSIVCLEEQEYFSKMQEVVDTLDVTILKNDPTKMYSHQTKKVMEESTMLFPTPWDIRKTVCMNPQPPEMYGLIKLHKEGHPARPVVSYIDAPTERKDSFQDVSKDGESNEKKLPYPKSVFFIISNEFCERFNYYGMRTILVLYLTDILLYTEADAKIIYHTFTMFVYFFPVFGAILSDSYLGKFRTILYVSMIYAVGSILIALTSAEPLGIPQKEFSILGLLLIAVGTGGIKPCVSAFGGDQFVLPQQEKQLALFFSLFYFSINAGSLISTSLTPVLRKNVHCFDENSCFPLAFALPGVLMIVSIVVFGLGKSLYKVKQPGGNVVVEVCKCIICAISNKRKSKDKKEHWLDYAEDKYGPKLVRDIKSTLSVLVLYLPLPIFWALYDQQGSGWTFQAVRMDGDIGFYTILPDQMQVVNPLLILSFIPIFTYWVYPLLAKCNLLKTPLQRMACGGLLAAAAFAISAVVSIALESTYPELPSEGNIQIRMYNPSACPATFNVDNLNLTMEDGNIIDSFGYKKYKDIKLSGNVNLSISVTSNCLNMTETQKVPVIDGNSYGIYIAKGKIHYYLDEIAKSEVGLPRIRTLDYTQEQNITYKMDSYSLNVVAGNDSLKSLSEPGKYKFRRENGTESFSYKFLLGGIYTVMLNDTNHEVIIVTEPNSVHMLWLLPQYFVITGAEIMFSVTGLEFSYSQAPSSMKSLMQACWLLTTAFGNLIIVIIESAKIFDKQSNDFFLYTALMVLDMVLFIYLALRYTYVLPTAVSESELEERDGDRDEKEKNGLDNPSYKEK